MTFTLIATAPAQGLLGMATASRSLALGRSVPAIDPTVGAVASQAWTNRALRHHLLAALRAGDSAAQATAKIPDLDADSAYRQAAVVDRAGGVGVHTGDMTPGWSGHVRGEHHAALGNCLTGGEVVQAMAETYDAEHAAAAGELDPVLEFAQLLVAALEAGEDAGGDARGRESAALMVARTSDHWMSPPELAVDLRVDHHRQPVTQLQSLVLRRIAEFDGELPRGRP